MGGGLGAAAWRMKKRRSAADKAEAGAKPAVKDNLETLLRVEPLAIEIGLGLVKFVSGGQESAAHQADRRNSPPASQRNRHHPRTGARGRQRRR